MKKKIDCFIAAGEEVSKTMSQLRSSGLMEDIFIISPEETEITGAKCLKINHPLSTQAIRQIAANSTAPYVLLALGGAGFSCGQSALERMLQVAENTRAAMVYADYYEIKNGQLSPVPVIDYQEGSLRDDFNFGPVQLYRRDVIAAFAGEDFLWAGVYSLRLLAARMGEVVRIPEFLFTKQETDLRRSGEKQFDYVAASSRERQVEMEKACTSHLRKVGALLLPPFKEVDFVEQDFPVEVSVVIPVRNRIRTIRDAVESVLLQKASFSFNLIVVDNYSTDGTTELLAEYTIKEKLIHIIPERKDLGIGGCWNEAVFSPFCGKFTIQLDSDDLYSDENTLQTIVDKFYDDKCAMVIGSYRMTDFDLNEIPPGVIRHDEWTPENGPNNALRINGMGAPRAFYTPVLRQTGVPNVSYGEDYAVGLAISREFKIGRIYEPIYLCRRWDDNTDASLDIAKLNAHNHYKDWIRTVELKARKELVLNSNLNAHLFQSSKLWKRCSPDEFENLSEMAKSLVRDQQETWPLLKQNYEGLDKTETKVYGFDGFRVVGQYNPERIRSSAAKTDAQSIAERPCFLCPQNLPPQQKGFMIFEKYLVLANPYPIFPVHLTISDLNHTPQKIEGRLGDLLRISRSFEGFTVFYNGPKCGASAPDHFHFQAGIRGFLPVEEEVATNSVLIRNDNKINIRASRDYLRTFIAFESGDAGQIEEQFEKFIREMERLQHPVEPMMNIVCWFEIGNWQLVVFPRGKQRPCHFYLEGDEKIVVGPAAVEMGGVMVLPRKEDFEKITSLDISEIYREVSLGEDEFGELIETAKTQWRKDS